MCAKDKRDTGGRGGCDGQVGGPVGRNTSSRGRPAES